MQRDCPLFHAAAQAGLNGSGSESSSDDDDDDASYDAQAASRLFVDTAVEGGPRALSGAVRMQALIEAYAAPPVVHVPWATPPRGPAPGARRYRRNRDGYWVWYDVGVDRWRDSSGRFRKAP